MPAGTSKSWSSSGSQALARRSMSSVRLALLTSVTWAAPPVSFQTSQVSMVPNAAAPESAFSRAPRTLRRSQASLVAEKYGSSTRPVFSRNRASWPAALRRAHSSVVRRSCQTMAWWSGRRGAAIPQPGRLPLVGDPDRGHVLALQARLAQRPLHGGDGGVPDLLEVVLHPSWPGEHLPELLVHLGPQRQLAVEDQHGGAGGALVDGEHVRGHVTPSLAATSGSALR